MSRRHTCKAHQRLYGGSGSEALGGSVTSGQRPHGLVGEDPQGRAARYSLERAFGRGGGAAHAGRLLADAVSQKRLIRDARYTTDPNATYKIPA